MTISPYWKFDVYENGSWVAGGDCSSKDAALSEASHYVMMYGQDGGEVKALVRGPSTAPETIRVSDNGGTSDD